MPQGSTFVTTIPPAIYKQFHQWNVTPQEKVGLVGYLRAIARQAGLGAIDFQGFEQAPTAPLEAAV